MASIINKLNVGQIVNVKLTDNPIINGQNLVSAYNYAKTLTPNGQSLSSTNRVAIIIMPGVYSLSSELLIDTQFVDLIGVGAQKLERGSIPAVNITNNTLNITANDIRVQGISVGEFQEFKIGNNLPLQRFEDCAGGDYSFGGEAITVAGTFINCTSKNFSFGGFGTASGIFINCFGENYCFGAAGIASGIFINCSGQYGAFGGYGTASGTFTNCIAEEESFGYFGTASGTFKNCVGGNFSFSGGFGGSIANGRFENCTAGDNSFGSLATNSGIFINCTGGVDSFIGFPGFNSGKLYNCRLTVGTFGTLNVGGILRNCIDGNNDIIDGQA